MKTNALGIALAAILMYAVTAQPDEAESQNVKIYGDCFVFDDVDLLTDEVIPGMLCHAEGEGRVVVMEFLAASQRVISFIVEGIQLPKMRLDVVYRFDQGELHKSTTTAQGRLLMSDHELVEFLDEFAKSDRLVFSVDGNGAKIKLNGSAKAVADFKKRTGRSKLRQRQKR